MSSVITSEDIYIYWCRNATWKSGAPATDKHQAFNPIVESAGIRMPEQVYDLLTPVGKLSPVIEVDKRLEPSTITFRTYFRDPFMLLAMFTYNTYTDTWTGTGDVITGAFTNAGVPDRTYETKNICVQLHLEDKSGSANHVNLLFDGGKITGYRWIIEEGAAMVEEIDIKFAEISENTQAIDIDDGFDDGSMNGTGLDGGWSLWDGQLCTSLAKVVHASDCTLTVGGSAIAGLHVQRATLEIDVPKAMEFVASSKTAAIAYDEKRAPFKATFSGALKDNSDISEAITALSSKTKATVKFQYATNKYMQFTNAILQNIEDMAIPAAGEKMDVNYVYEGAGSSVLSYSWTGNEANDPANMINGLAV